MKKALVPVLVFSMALNLLLIAAIANQGFGGLPKAKAVTDISQPGTYGPPAMEVIDGDASINTNDVVLQNTLVTGNLLLSKEIDGGVITLQQVEVQGEVIIAGSNFTLFLTDSGISRINLAGEGVKLIARGITAVSQVRLGGGGALQEDALSESASGFSDVLIETAAKVSLVGNFEDIELAVPNADLKLLKGAADSINIADDATDAILELSEGVRVGSLCISARAALVGAGGIGTVDLNAPGLITLQGEIGEVYCRVEGIYLELQAGRIARFIVAELEQATAITLAAGTVVDVMELNGRTGVSGEGVVAKAFINAQDISFEQMPGEIIIPANLAVFVGGEEYKAPPEPEPEPEPERSRRQRRNRISQE